MKKTKTLATLLFITIICTGCPNSKCEDCHQHITFVNKSDMHINCDLRRIRDVNDKDSILCVIDLKDFIFSLLKNNSGLISCSNIDRDCDWESELNSDYIVQIQVIDNNVCQHYIDSFGFDNDSIQKYVPILHCYQLTLEDLQRMNWTVVYPPEE